MKKLYAKSKILFSVILIIIYVLCGSLSEALFNTKAAPMILYLILSVIVLIFLKKNVLMKEYGLCKVEVAHKSFLYYIPLIFLSSVNLWFGVRMNMSVFESCFFVISMICVGFLEEIIFRGFLFKAMAKDNLKSAIIVSSVTFGIGHIVNLLNGTAESLVSNFCQIFSAIAFGFLFVIIFQKGKSLIPCIISHITINSLSAFANEEAITNKTDIIISIILFLVAITYAYYIHKKVFKNS